VEAAAAARFAPGGFNGGDSVVCLTGKMDGPARRAVNTPADHFTPGYREPSMHTKSTTAPVDRLAKRNRLKEIVAELGRDATPAEIRVAAYQRGFGQVNGPMLVYVRNELWPDRPKKRGGRTNAPETRMVLSPGYRDAMTCPPCGSLRTACKKRYFRDDGVTVRLRFCRDCGHKWRDECNSQERLNKSDSAKARALAAIEKECSHCKKMLPVACFTKRGPDLILYRSRCKECEGYLRRVSHRGNRSLLKLYGITADDYQTMLAAQGGLCAICGKPDSGKRRNSKVPLNVDHCHTTGKVRGLLCTRCNLGIGNFDDDIGRFETAIAYIRRHGSA
jgi:hypothetical protein